MSRHPDRGRRSGQIIDWSATNGYPMGRCQLIDNPITAEPAKAAVLLPSKRVEGHVGDGAVVDMGHPRVDPQRKANAPGFVPRKDRARKPAVSRVRKF